MRVEDIMIGDVVTARIFYNQPMAPGVYFYNENASTLQVGKQLRLKGEQIKPHRHLPVKIQREETLKEVLYIEKGRVRINFYNDRWEEIDSRILAQGDMILLIKGGHGFEMLEETEMIEVKEGHYDPAAVERMKEGS
jgi:hypothetical protein